MMAWIADLKITEVIEFVGVLTAFIAATTTFLTARWNKKSVISEEVLATLRQQLELSKQQASATELHLKEQLAYYKELSPADIQKQLLALRSLLTERVQELENKLEESLRMLREKTEELSHQKMAEAVMMGYGRIFLGINDAELFARALAGLITQYGRTIDFGEVDLSVKSFYVGFMRLLIFNNEFVKEFVSNSPEWILDYVVMPLLACVKYKTLAGSISDILEKLFAEMHKTSYAHEVPIY